MAGRQRASGARKQPDRYHHGDLPRALLREAVHTIQRHGVEALTLRGVGEGLGVSRTALYRHFANKQALLGAGRRRGIPNAADELDERVDGRRARRGRVRRHGPRVRPFRRAPSVTLSRDVRPLSQLAHRIVDDRPGSNPDESMDAFGVLVDAIVEQQRHGIGASRRSADDSPCISGPSSTAWRCWRSTASSIARADRRSDALRPRANPHRNPIREP